MDFFQTLYQIVYPWRKPVQHLVLFLFFTFKLFLKILSLNNHLNRQIEIEQKLLTRLDLT